MCSLALKAVKGERYTIGDIFSTDNNYGKSLGIFVLSVAVVVLFLNLSVALILLLTPFIANILLIIFIACSIFFIFVYWLIADDESFDLSLSSVIVDSILLVRYNFLKIFATLLILILLDIFAIIGTISSFPPLYMTRVITIPLSFLIITQMYLDLNHQEE
ncbi:hypothetical protein PRVXT_002682 [Proteinivorax tanatarense]|uniref:Uncharacterized protein n=1 Tax=Proteinivorax tanatarense TaxID=1260629 RepID=A0AAU7VL18_9FIRM